ncbi:MAG TPA: hypothetical protein VK864_04260, partial [Longimicrobiales bacterium]|nr:hypothetical protein [Longimicrobiales bacterium]
MSRLRSEPTSTDERWWLITTALGVWLGVHALRGYLSMAVWNLADELPLELKSVLPIAVHLPGLLAWPAARLLGEQRALGWFGAAFAGLYALRSLLGELDVAVAIVAFAAWILWLWWLPALLKAAAHAGARHTIAPAAVLGISLQLAGQTLLHGLDVPLLRGTSNVVLSVTLAGALLFANSHLTSEPAARPEQF